MRDQMPKTNNVPPNIPSTDVPEIIKLAAQIQAERQEASQAFTSVKEVEKVAAELDIGPNDIALAMATLQTQREAEKLAKDEAAALTRTHIGTAIQMALALITVIDIFMFLQFSISLSAPAPGAVAKHFSLGFLSSPWYTFDYNALPGSFGGGWNIHLTSWSSLLILIWAMMAWTGNRVGQWMGQPMKQRRIYNLIQIFMAVFTLAMSAHLIVTSWGL